MVGRSSALVGGPGDLRLRLPIDVRHQLLQRLRAWVGWPVWMRRRSGRSCCRCGGAGRPWLGVPRRQRPWYEPPSGRPVVREEEPPRIRADRHLGHSVDRAEPAVPPAVARSQPAIPFAGPSAPTAAANVIEREVGAEVGRFSSSRSTLPARARTTLAGYRSIETAARLAPIGLRAPQASISFRSRGEYSEPSPLESIGRTRSAPAYGCGALSQSVIASRILVGRSKRSGSASTNPGTLHR